MAYSHSPRLKELSAFYSLWSAREALFKLQCNLGREIRFATIVGDKNAPLVQSNGWHRYQLPIGNLSVEVV